MGGRRPSFAGDGPPSGRPLARLKPTPRRAETVRPADVPRLQFTADCVTKATRGRVHTPKASLNLYALSNPFRTAFPPWREVLWSAVRPRTAFHMMPNSASQDEFHPSYATRTSTPRSAGIAHILAAIARSSPVTISDPQWVMTARSTPCFCHHTSCVRTGEWPISALPRLRMNERMTVAPSPM